MSRAGAGAGQQRQFADIGVRGSRQRPRAHGGQRGWLDAEHRIIVRAECGTDLAQVSGSCCSWIDRSDPDPLGSSSSRRESVGPRDTRFAECLLCRAVQAVILGMIAQAVTGEPIQQLITQGILRPLDLTHTSFPTAAAPPHLPVQGYTVEGKDALPTSVFESPAELSRSDAAGAMISTVADLQVWARAPAAGALLSPSMQRQRLELVPMPLPAH
jgi:hypothetical protein